jgi:hypothetical protein
VIPPSPGAPRSAFVACLALLVVTAAVPVAAQVDDTAGTPIDSVIVLPGADPVVVATQDTTPQPISPRGAFIRSMILPGWGQAEFEAYFRGGIYFAGWAANWFMNFRNYTRLGDARAMFDLRQQQLIEELVAVSPNPDSTRAELEEFGLSDEQIAADPGPRGADDLNKLVDAREQQREDWIAWSLFWLLASGVDAYVTAHLSDFPGTIDVEPGSDRSISLRMRVPTPHGWP